MRGLAKFKEYFGEYSENYILIGGTACAIILNESGVDFRVAKVFDIVIIAENLHEEFARRMWEFIKS